MPRVAHPEILRFAQDDGGLWPFHKLICQSRPKILRFAQDMLSPPKAMFPTLIKIGNFEITTFGLMMFLAFVAAGWVLSRQFRRYRLSEDSASSMVMAAAIGGIVGAKIYYAILFRDWHLLFTRAGLVWYGGLIGGALACFWLILKKPVGFFTAPDAASPPLAIGYSPG